MKFAKSLRTPIFKNICERLLLNLGILDLHHSIDIFESYILVTVINIYAPTLASKFASFVCRSLSLILFSSFFTI